MNEQMHILNERYEELLLSEDRFNQEVQIEFQQIIEKYKALRDEGLSA